MEKLAEVAERYSAQLDSHHEIRGYLAGRGLSRAAIAVYQLGVVDGSLPEHAPYRGMIAIPYLTKLGGVKGFKFRVAHNCDETHDHQKYLTPYETRIFNPAAFDMSERLGYIGIAEGEFDAMIATCEAQIPTVGIPGIDTWLKHPEWPVLFDGYERIIVFRDMDEAGLKLARRLEHDLKGVQVTSLPAKDVNATFLRYGKDAIRKAAGL